MYQNVRWKNKLLQLEFTGTLVNCTFYQLMLMVHRQNVEVTNAEWTKRRTTKRQMGQNAECQNVE
jgi:hypothetical protein